MADTAPGQVKEAKTFSERMKTDADFSAQVEESRMRRERVQTTASIKSALALASGIPGAKPKMY
jgi:hypothetical protein